MTFKSFIENLGYSIMSGDIPISKVLMCHFMAMVFGLYIYFCYRTLIKNEFYSKDFNSSLVLMSLITCAIVLSIQSNLVVSLGMVGALSIVRYRTAIKSSIDLAFMFWSISIGIICGASLFKIAIVLSVLITITIFVLNSVKSSSNLGLLIVNYSGEEHYQEIIECLKKQSKFLRLKNKVVSKNNSELVVEYRSSKKQDLEKALNGLSFVIDYSIVNYDRENRI